MVLPLGLLYFLTWEMVRNQSVGGGKCVSWFLFCVVTQRRPQRPNAVELSEETEIGACWYGINETHRNILNEDLPVILWREARGKQMWRWRESDRSSGIISTHPSHSAQAVGNSHARDSGHLLGVTVDRALTNYTCARRSLVLCLTSGLLYGYC